MKRGIPAHLPLVLALGAVCQIGQIILLRELLMVFHGNELSIGIVLGFWMVWVGLGSLLAGRRRETEPHGHRRTLIRTGIAVPFVLPATVVLIRMLRTLFPVPPGAYLSVTDMAVSVLIVMAPVGLLLGSLFVYLARTWREWDRAEDTGGAGKTYITEALGSAGGGVLFTLVIVGRVGSLHTVAVIGIVLAVATLVSLPSGTRGRLGLTIVITVLGVAFPFLGQLDRWAHELQWGSFAPDHELVTVRDSRYGKISVAWRDGQYSFYQSGNLVFSAAGRPPGLADDPDHGDGTVTTSVASDTPFPLEEQQAIAAAHLAMTQHPAPARVLLLGGGLRGTLREILRHPLEHLDYVELDPVLTETARRYLPGETTASLARDEVRLIHGDGRRFLKAERPDAGPERYDLIIVDLPDPATAVLNRYYTEEFFLEAAEHLASNGVLAISVGSTPDLRGTAIANRNSTLFHTLQRVFPEVLPVGDRVLTFFAAREPGVLSTDPWTLQARFFDRQIRHAAFSPRQFTILLEGEPLRRIGWILRHHGRDETAHLAGPGGAPLLPPSLPEQEALARDLPPVVERYFINTDLRPIGYVHTLSYWNTLTRGTGDAVFRWSLKVRPWWILPPAALAVLAAAGLRFRRTGSPDASRRFAVLCAVFTTGLSTMALQVALLMTFQSVFGYVYEMIGLIIAAFMGGLALGTLAARRFVPDPGDIRVLRTVQLGIAFFAVLIGLVLPVLTTIASTWILPGLFFLLTVFAGALNGFDFPLTSACCHRIGGDPDKAAGLVYGTELFGACAGALVAGVVVAPVLGIVACCYLAATGNALAHGILWIPGRGEP